MVVIPAGSFTMGSPADEPGRSSNEGPQHQVTFANLFAVGKYPITVGQWEAFVTDTARDPDNYKAKGCLIGTDGETAAPTLNSPVVCVNWKDTQEYVAWLSGKTGKSYRLLSESEWEYAARAGTTTPYPFSATLGTTDVATGDELANYANGTGVYLGLDIYMYTSPVGSFPPNAIGLYDMIGNVSEWTQDCYHNDYTDAPADGSAWVTDCAGTYRVLRNGSWLTGIPQLLRSAFRVASPTLRYNFTGFRVARALP
jgi:formylglycine-generating enzyme required for sulfatase activity